LRASSALLGVERGLWILAVSRLFLSHRSPAPLDTSSFHRTGPPSESLTTFQPSDLSAGAAFHEVSAPYNGILDRAPYEAGTTRANLGSALRFSQPLSGFLARSSSTALFHAATSSWAAPLQSVPPTRFRGPLSSPTGSCGYSTCLLNVLLLALSPPVSPTRALLTHLPCSLRRLWTPFPRARARFPVVLGLEQTNRSFG